MRKTLTLILAFILLFTLSACGSKKSLDEFDTNATIEKVTIYNENNIKIIANELTYGNFSAKLSVTFENNTDEDLSFVCGSLGYSVNSVNGWMVNDGYLNCDVTAGQTATETISFNFNALNAYGITSIADIEVGFSIHDTEYNYTYTGPLQIKTSIADKYDYLTNHYQSVITNGAFENRFNCKINYFSDNKLYEKYNICINSVAVMTNSDGEPMVVLEISNNSNEQVYIEVEDIKLNDYSVYDSTWSSEDITANKKYIIYLSLTDLADKYEGDFTDISKIKNISFKFSIGEKWYEIYDSEKINISLPSITIPEKED